MSRATKVAPLPDVEAADPAADKGVVGPPPACIPSELDSAKLSMRQQPEEGRRINLRSAVMDTYEYHGMRYLAWRVLFWGALVAAFFSTYSREQIVNSANMVAQLASFGDTEDWQQRAFKDQSTFHDAASYMMDWATTMFKNAMDGEGNSAQPSPSAGVLLGDYSNLNFMRVVLDLDTSCRHASLPCHRTDNVTLTPGVWAPSPPNAPSFLYGSSRLLTAVIYSSGSQNSSAEALARLEAVAQDMGVAAQYGFKLSLEVVCDFSPFPGKNTWVALNVQRSSTVPNDVRLDYAVSVYISTLDLAGDRPFSGLTFFLMGLVLLCTLAYTTTLIRSIWFYDLQRMHEWRTPDASGVPGQEPPRKAGWAWCIATYFTYSLWNSLELVALLVSFFWCLVYAYGACVTLQGDTYFNRERHLAAVFSDEGRMNRLITWGCLTGLWYELGGFTILLNGLSLYPYFRVHRGLRLYLNVLSAAWKAVLDFITFFAFVFLLIGFFCLATTQLPGVQPDLTYPMTAFSALAKLMLGFYGYDEFVNSSVPKSNVLQTVQTVVFWVSVIMLFIFVQNILLAIVAVAYDEARSSEGTAEASFLFVVLIRLLWYPVLGYYRLYKRASLLQMAQALQEWPTSTFTLYFNRWALACTSEAQSLQAYYTFYLNWHYCPRSPWLHDPFKTKKAGAGGRAGELPPHSVDVALTKEQLAACLQDLSDTPSFQRMVAITLPWPLHRRRAYQWDGAACGPLAEHLWALYSYSEEDAAITAGSTWGRAAAVLLAAGIGRSGARDDAGQGPRRHIFNSAAGRRADALSHDV